MNCKCNVLYLFVYPKFKKKNDLAVFPYTEEQLNIK